MEIRVDGDFLFELFEPEHPREGAIFFEDQRARQDVWEINGHAWKPELRQALVDIGQEIKAKVRGFMEEHRTELEQTRRRCEWLCYHNGFDCLAELGRCPLTASKPVGPTA